MQYDRLEIFDDGETPETWLWCLHCERCYQLKEMRQVGEYQLCHYPDCNGDTVLDAWNWREFRQGQPERRLPKVPKRGVRYGQYG